MEISDTILAPLFSIWWKGAVWLAIASLLAAILFLGKTSAGKRRIFWASTFGGLAILAALPFVGPRWQIATPEFAETLPFPVTPEVTEANEIASAPALVTSTPTTAEGTAAISEIAVKWSPLDFGFLIWVVGTAVLALRLLFSRWRLQRLWKNARPADAIWISELEATRRQLGLRKTVIVDLRQSDEISAPMVWGIFGARILLPLGFEASRRLILLHELQHAKRRDPLLNLVAQTCLLIHWPNPLAWLAARRLRLAQEKACDDHVLSLSVDSDSAENYADLLVALARKPHACGRQKLEPIAALSMTSRPSALRKRITSILDHTMKRKQPHKAETLLIFALHVIAAGALAMLTFGESASAQEKRETDELKKRVAELEAEVKDLKDDSADAIDAAKLEKNREENKIKARERMREDRNEYDNEELQEIEKLYQVANKNWRTEEAKTSLEALIKKYKKANRTGCAVLYLGQMSTGEQRENYLRKAVDDFSDCYYGNGCQVGGYGRYLLAAYLRETGKDDEAKKLIAELEKKYATATGHSGKLIVSYLARLKAE